MLKVLNYLDFGIELPPNSKLVDRYTPFGNPFAIGPDGTREEVVAKYAAWIEAPEQDTLKKQVRRELRGFDLVCWCAPLACHADVLLKIANTVHHFDVILDG